MTGGRRHGLHVFESVKIEDEEHKPHGRTRPAPEGQATTVSHSGILANVSYKSFMIFASRILSASEVFLRTWKILIKSKIFSAVRSVKDLAKCT